MSGNAPAGAVRLGERVFWELLGLSPGAGRGAVKRAYHRKARENHPDFFPEDQKALQEIRMIALNEAYAYLLSLPDPSSRGGAAARERGGDPSVGWGSSPPGAGNGSPGPEAPSPQGDSAGPPAAAVGFHKDPAYAYYKQGFVHFSRAIHGIEALYQSLARYPRIRFRPRDDAYERFAGSLVELRRSHEYFSRVVGEYGGSIWGKDAELKLGRIERFSALYRRIIGNLTGSA